MRYIGTQIINDAKNKMRATMVHLIKECYYLTEGVKHDNEDYIVDLSDSGLVVSVEVDDSYLDVEERINEWWHIKEIQMTADEEDITIVTKENEGEFDYDEVNLLELAAIVNVLNERYNQIVA